MNLEPVGRGARTLVILPGWRLDSEVEKLEWLPIIERRPGWRGVFVDPPGVGRARDVSPHIVDQAQVLVGLLELLDAGDFGAHEIAIAGASNGAALAIGMARRRPEAVQGLALRVPRFEADDAAREAAGRAEWERAFESLPEAARAAHRVKEERVWEPARQRTDLEFLKSIREDPARYRLPDEQEPFDFQGPVLAVLGRQDARIGWQLAWEYLHHLPRATIALLDRAAHQLPAGDTQIAVWQALSLDWLARVEEMWPAPGGNDTARSRSSE
jgi:pimeloyl-ACP methyl ester carboxylesterase